jgi:hypothetical protein
LSREPPPVAPAAARLPRFSPKQTALVVPAGDMLAATGGCSTTT